MARHRLLVDAAVADNTGGAADVFAMLLPQGRLTASDFLGTCADAGMLPVCEGGVGCPGADGRCLPLAVEAGNCGHPMRGVARALGFKDAAWPNFANMCNYEPSARSVVGWKGSACVGIQAGYTSADAILGPRYVLCARPVPAREERLRQGAARLRGENAALRKEVREAEAKQAAAERKAAAAEATVAAQDGLLHQARTAAAAAQKKVREAADRAHAATETARVELSKERAAEAKEAELQGALTRLQRRGGGSAATGATLERLRRAEDWLNAASVATLVLALLVVILSARACCQGRGGDGGPTSGLGELDEPFLRVAHLEKPFGPPLAVTLKGGAAGVGDGAPPPPAEHPATRAPPVGEPLAPLRAADVERASRKRANKIGPLGFPHFPAPWNTSKAEVGGSGGSAFSAPRFFALSRGPESEFSETLEHPPEEYEDCGVGGGGGYKLEEYEDCGVGGGGHKLEEGVSFKG